MASKYDITQSPIWIEVMDIAASGAKPVKVKLQGMVHTTDADLPVVKVVSYDVCRDYANNIGDVMEVEFLLGLGDYAAKVYPKRANLEFSLKITTLQESGQSEKTSEKIKTLRFKAVFLPDVNESPAGSDADSVDTDALNSKGFLNVRLQLIDRNFEALRIKTIEGAFREATPEQLIYCLVMGEASKILVDAKPVVDAIDIVEPDNKEARGCAAFKSGTKILNIPTIIQEQAGGVYTSGIGTYFQRYEERSTIFVYPIFNTTRFKKSQCDRAIFYAVPKGRLDGMDRTYSTDGTILKVVATGQKKYSDTTDTDYMDKGSGFRMNDARALLKKPALLTKEGATASRGRFNFEVAAEEREDGLNYLHQAEGPSSNPYKEYSKVTSRKTARIDLEWQNAQIDLLYPGMPCKYVFMDQDELVELHGTVVFAQAATALNGASIISSLYLSTATLVLLCESKSTSRKSDTESHGDY